MPSITYWNRLEPRPVSPSIAETLAARLRDPLWLLSRQWQMGEFHGEDAGSPAYVRARTTCTPITGWRTGTGAWQPIDGSAPLDALMQVDAFDSSDLSLQVEVAHVFEKALRARPGFAEAHADAVLAEMRLKLPLAAPSPADHATVRFYTVCAPRAFNGIKLYETSSTVPPTLPAGVVIDPGDLADVEAAQSELAAWVTETLGPIGSADPPAWREDRLEYEASLSTSAPGGSRVELTVRPELEGDIDWYAIDVSNPAPGNLLPTGVAAVVNRTVLPINVRFRGMPNARWWDFEDARTDFGDLRPDRRDAAKLVVMDFMLVHGNDWFVIPFDQNVGSICRVDELAVHDVFGGVTHVPRADHGGENGLGRWTLFSSAVEGNADSLGEFLVIPPSVTTARQNGQPLEEVRFFRDEMANLVWAVEHVVTGGAGDPWPGSERSVAAAPPPPAVSGMLRYEIQTYVPYNWIPFVPVAVDVARGDIALERAALLDISVAPPTPVPPAGRVLQPRAGAEPYRIREEEVSRAGVRVRRVACRSRWIDGSTWLWVMRQRLAGMGEGASGLQFDRATKSI